MMLPWSWDDIPSGTSAFVLGFSLLLGALMSLTSGRSTPGPYHQLITKTGTVRDVSSGGRASVVSIELDTLPATSRLMLTDPELGGAQALLWRVRRGAQYDVTYDPWTQRIWEVEPTRGTSSSGPDYRARLATDVHFGPSDIATWRVEDQAAGRTRAKWLGILGALALISAVVQMVRSSPNDSENPS